MDPFDSAKNDDTGGYSRRRISSILKAPRKSIKFSDQEQVENPVEITKPVEKRSSRRVSFAAANDVLLFSKDVKNVSPARSPLQDLIAAAATTENRVQMVVTEEGIQQITGMETLLNAPLHTAHQRHKVNFEDDHGEKTVMFATDDAFMDMTHSHTINIAYGSDFHGDFQRQKGDILPACGDKTVVFTADDGSMDMTQCHTVNLAVQGFDPGFKSFLAGLSKPSASSVNPVITRMVPPAAPSKESVDPALPGFLVQLKTQRTDVDKENQAPTHRSSVIDVSVNKTRKSEGLFNQTAVYPEDDDVSMDMTEAQTGQILGFTDTEALGSSSLKGVTTENRVQLLNPEAGVKTLLNPPLHASQRRKVNFGTQDDCREKTVMFTADDAFMDITQSHTVNIASNSKYHSLLPFQNPDIFHTSGKVDFPLPLEKRKSGPSDPPSSSSSSSVHGCDPGFKDFLASLSKPDISHLNPAITRVVPTATPSKKTYDPNDFLQHKRPDMDKKGQTQTSASFMVEKSIHKTGKKTGGSSVEGAGGLEEDLSMDMTEAQTGRILESTGTEDQLQHLFPTKAMYSDNRVLKTTKVTYHQQSSEALGSSNPKGLETTMNAPQRRHWVKFAENDHREKTVVFAADDAFMDMTKCHTVNIATGLESQPFSQNSDFSPTCGEKTKMFTANDACMDMTQCHTVNIATTDPVLQSVLPHPNANILSTHGNMDFNPNRRKSVVHCKSRPSSAHGVDLGFNNIIASLSKPSGTNVSPLTTTVVTVATAYPQKIVNSIGSLAQKADVDDSEAQHCVSSLMEKPQNKTKKSRESCNGAEVCLEDDVMDMTEAQTGHIWEQNCIDERPQCLNPTQDADDACMDMTKSHTVNIVGGLESVHSQKFSFVPSGEKTMTFTANDASMDITRCHTVNIAVDSVSRSVLPRQNASILSTSGNMDLAVKKRKSVTCVQPKNRPSSAHGMDLGFNNILTDLPTAATSPQETTNTTDSQLEKRKADEVHDVEALSFVSTVTPSEINKNGESNLGAISPEDDASMDMTAAQTGHILMQTYTDEPSPCISPSHSTSLHSDNLKTMTASPQQSSEAQGSCSNDDTELAKLAESHETNERETSKDPELRDESSSSQRSENSPDGPAVVHDADKLPSKTAKNRRLSLADLQSKVRRLSHMVNEATENVAMDSCTTSLPLVEQDLDKQAVKTSCLPVGDADLEMGLVDTDDKTQSEHFTQRESTTPFNSKTTRLMSRLSMGGFLPKLPQRGKATDPCKPESSLSDAVGEHMRTNTITLANHLTIVDEALGNINDEVLGGDEDLSEMLDMKGSREICEEDGLTVDQDLVDDAFEEAPLSVGHVKKRPLPQDLDYVEDEKRMKPSTDLPPEHSVEVGLQSHVIDRDSRTAPSAITQTIDSSTSCNTTSVKCEAAYESALKQSLFESQLEDCTNDVQKLDDSSITVLEFFKLFNLDFVIHHPRQSVLPGRVGSPTDRTPIDLLKDRHINHPKQMVYESDLKNLTEKMEGLKVRKRDLEKPLKSVNRRLWEEMRGSSEKELKCFGAKLKEMNNFFRKTSKVKSHEMKEVLYSSLARANLEEQHKLKGKLKEADEMLTCLDDCISELERELDPVEVKGGEDKPSLKSQQLEMERVTRALADNDKEMAELEMQKKQNLDKLKRFEAEEVKFKSHIPMLEMLNEWKFAEKRDNCTVYTFLYETLHLLLAYEKSDGTAANGSERKISHITFQLQLDDEKSQGHARLVHKLLSQYFEGDTAWVEKYPMSTCIPKLLHDVGLVVSRCRLLGEELRLLKLWGGLRLNILHISCVDTRVHIVFSCLKAFSKFEVTFAVSLIHQLYVLQVQSFKNVIGSTTIQQIEEIVASFAPAKNLLTRTVKKINDTLLC